MFLFPYDFVTALLLSVERMWEIYEKISSIFHKGFWCKLSKILVVVDDFSEAFQQHRIIFHSPHSTFYSMQQSSL